MSYRVVTNGETMRVPMRLHRVVCCDCKLVHDYSYRYRRGKLWVTTRRNERATVKRRAR